MSKRETGGKKSSLNKVQRVKPLAALRKGRGGDFICFFVCVQISSFLKVEPQS